MSHSGTSENRSHWLARPALNCWLSLLSPSHPSTPAPAHSKPSSSQRDLLPGWWQQQPHRDGASNLPSSARQGPERTSGLHPWVASTLRAFSSPLGCQPAPPGTPATADKTEKAHTCVRSGTHEDGPPSPGQGRKKKKRKIHGAKTRDESWQMSPDG